MSFKSNLLEICNTNQISNRIQIFSYLNSIRILNGVEMWRHPVLESVLESSASSPNASIVLFTF